MSNNNSRQICKQAIIKLSLACSFRKMLFIGQNLKYVHMTYSFLELLIFFWLMLDTISIWSLFLTSRKKYSMWIQTLWETNHEIKTIIFKNLFFNVKLKFLMLWINLNFSQFHEHIFRAAVVRRFSSKYLLLNI